MATVLTVHVPICLEKQSPVIVAFVVFVCFFFHYHSENFNSIRTLSKSNHTNSFSSSFLPKQWPLCGPCQLQNRSGREWSSGAAVFFCVSARVLLPFSPTIALPFEATDCCSCAQGFCGGDIQSHAILLILRPTDHGTIGWTLVPTRIGHHSRMT